MAALLKIRIVTPTEVAYEGTALAATIPAETGQIQVYPGHIPLLARLAPGEIVLEMRDAAPVRFEVEEGLFRVTPSEVGMLVDTVRLL